MKYVWYANGGTKPVEKCGRGGEGGRPIIRAVSVKVGEVWSRFVVLLG